MLTCEIVDTEELHDVIRYDVRVEIPGIYSEIISYMGEATADPHCATVVMTRARTYALSVFRKRIAMAAGLPEPGEKPDNTQTTSRRRRRTKAEMEADRAAEEAQRADADRAINDSLAGQEPPVEAPVETPESRQEPEPKELPELLESAAPVFGIPMERCAAHEAILRDLLIAAFGDRWMDRPEVKSAAVMMATHAITNGVLVVDGDGNPHPQIRALFAEMVTQVCHG